MIINLTPYPITINGITIEPDGRVPRVAEVTTPVDSLTHGGVSIPVVEVTLGQVEGLPKPAPGTWYVVSRMTAEAARGRGDLLIPGKQIRDERGRIMGAESLARLP